MNLRKFGGVDGGFTLCIDKDGWEHVLVVAKATFDIEPDGRCRLAVRQQPVAMADEHHGDPASSSLRYECDFALRKPLTDVIVNGSAHAPQGREVTEIQVGLALGSIRKVVRVLGDRVWERQVLGGCRPSAPRRFATMPLLYERAFGGHDIRPPDPSTNVHELRNLVGTGYFADAGKALGTPVANLEHPDHPITSCTERSMPVGFGFVSRNWQPRVARAGTYDEAWQAERFPYLPADFDDLYFQGAPEDQRCPHLTGGERAVLANMTPQGRLEFEIPSLPVSMYLVNRSGHDVLQPVLDTLIIEPDAMRCLLVWRASMRLTRKLTDIREVWVGVPTPGMVAAMRGEKRYLWGSRLAA